MGGGGVVRASPFPLPQCPAASLHLLGLPSMPCTPPPFPAASLPHLLGLPCSPCIYSVFLQSPPLLWSLAFPQRHHTPNSPPSRMAGNGCCATQPPRSLPSCLSRNPSCLAASLGIQSLSPSRRLAPCSLLSLRFAPLECTARLRLP